MRQGMGRLLVTEDEHNEDMIEKTLIFEEKSKYQAFKKQSDQQEAMTAFERKFNMNMYYLFYNPMEIPHSIKSPFDGDFSLEHNNIGCRIITKKLLDDSLKIYSKNYAPTYGDLKYLLSGDHKREEHTAGWRLEYFVTDLVMKCKEGLIDDSPNFKTVQDLLNQKSRPISSALSITIDYRE